MKQQSWLISYEAWGVDFATSGAIHRTGPARLTALVDSTPWKFLADRKRRMRDLTASPPKDRFERVDDVVVIFWAVQLPVGALTEEEIDLLS